MDANGTAGEALAEFHARAFTVAHRHVERRHPAQRRDHVTQRQLGHSELVRAGRVAEANLVFAQRVEIERVAADAHLADDLEIRQRREHFLGDRLHADDCGVAIGEQRDHVVLGRALGNVAKRRVGVELEQRPAKHRMAGEQAVGNTDLGRGHGHSLTLWLRLIRFVEQRERRDAAGPVIVARNIRRVKFADRRHADQRHRRFDFDAQ